MGWESVSIKFDNLKDYGLSETIISKIPKSYISGEFVSAAGLEHVGAIKSNNAILSFVDKKSKGGYSVQKGLTGSGVSFWGSQSAQEKRLSPYSVSAGNKNNGKNLSNPFTLKDAKTNSNSFFRNDNDNLEYVS